MISEGFWFGWVSLACSLPVYVLAGCYFLLFRQDSKENREFVSRAFKFQWQFNGVLGILLFIAILCIPAEDLPALAAAAGDSSEEKELSKIKKEDLKMLFLIALPIALAIVIGIQFYFYKVSLRWAQQESLIAGKLNTTEPETSREAAPSTRQTEMSNTR